MSKVGASANRTEEQKQRDRARERARYQRDRDKRLATAKLYAASGKRSARRKLVYDPGKNRIALQNRTPEQKAKYAETQQNRLKLNRAEVTEKAREWRRKNPDKVKAAKARYYQKHREEKLERDRQYRLANLEKKREYDRKRFHTERRQETTRQSRLRMVETIRNGWRNRSARKRGAVGRHTAQDVTNLFLKQNGKCAGCDIEMAISGKHRYHIDHYLPLILGGSNWPDNLQLLCPKCNHAKNAAPPEEWENKIKPRMIRERKREAA